MGRIPWNKGKKYELESRQGPCGLRKSEEEVIDLYSQGYTREEIAKTRHTSCSTVKQQLERIRRTLEAHNSTHAAVIYVTRCKE